MHEMKTLYIPCPFLIAVCILPLVATEVEVDSITHIPISVVAGVYSPFLALTVDGSQAIVANICQIALVDTQQMATNSRPAQRSVSLPSALSCPPPLPHLLPHPPLSFLFAFFLPLPLSHGAGYWRGRAAGTETVRFSLPSSCLWISQLFLLLLHHYLLWLTHYCSQGL